MEIGNQFLGTERIDKLMRQYAVPCIISLLVGALYNIVDQIFIANASYLGSYGNAANTVVFPLTVVALAIAVMVGDGCCAFVSMALGRNETARAKRSVGNAVVLIIVGSLILTAVYLIFANSIIAMFGGTVNEETYRHSLEYFFYITLGIPFYMFGQAMNPIIRADGNPKFAMISTLAGAVINIILDPIFIYTLGMGAAGAAIATVIGNICGDIFYVIFMIKKCRYLSVDFRKLKMTGAEVLAVLAIGIPASVTNFMQSIGVTLTNRFLQPYGTDKVAAMGIALKIIMISVLVMVGFAFGGQPLVGYNYGAKNKKRLSETIRFAFLLEVLTGAGMAVVLGAAAPLLVGLFLKEADVIAVAQQILRVQLIGMPFVGIVLASTCIFQAIGNGAGAMILSAGRQGVIFAIVIFCASKLAGFSGVIASQPVSDFLPALVAVMILLQWKKKEFAK